MNIKKIKSYLFTRIGSNIIILYYGSRNKKEKYSGVLYQLYDNVFTIKLITGEIKCFSYTDILIKNIQIYV